MYLAEDGDLTDDGVALIQREHSSDLDADDIRRIFNPHTVLATEQNRWRNRWRELVVKQEAIDYLEVRPVRNDGGTLRFSGDPTPGLLADSSRSRIVISNRNLRTVFGLLLSLDALNVTAATFQVAGSDLREWTIARYLAHTLRQGNDQLFAETYESTHVHYLSQHFTDPLQMIPRRAIETAGVRQQRMSLDQFWAVGDRNLRPSLRQRFRRGLPWLSDAQLAGAREWFSFLFPGFIGDLNGGGLHNCLANARSDCSDIPASNRPKHVWAKIPDLIQILVNEQRIEVLDPTMRPLTRWHNFKTGFYASVLATVMSNISSQGWAVVALDFRSKRYLTPI